MSFFERSLLEPNSARLTPGPEGYSITHLTPVLWWPMAFTGLKRDPGLTGLGLRNWHALPTTTCGPSWPHGFVPPFPPTRKGILGLPVLAYVASRVCTPLSACGFGPLVANVNLGKRWCTSPSGWNPSELL